MRHHSMHNAKDVLLYGQDARKIGAGAGRVSEVVVLEKRP